MPARRLVRPVIGLLVLAASAPPAAAQTTYTWTSAAPDLGPGQWLHTLNWNVNGVNTGKYPGVTAAGLPTDGTATDVARFNQFLNGSSQGVGIDFGAAGGRLSLGAIQFNDNPGGEAIGNLSTTTAGVLRLNGATVSSQLTGAVPNVVLANTSFNYGYYSLAPLPNGGTGGPGMTLELGTPDAVFLTVSSILWVKVPISEAAPGYGVSVRGGYEVDFLQPNTFSGPTKIVGGILNINRDSALGIPPSGPIPNRIVIAPDPAIPAAGVLSTNAATFEINANRGIAVGPATGTGDGGIDVPDPDVQGYLATITYNGVITNNGSGTGRLVKSGGGLLILGGSNTFTGGALINGGEVRLTNPNALGTAGTVTIAPQGNTVNVGLPLPGNLLVQATGTFARPIVVDYGGPVTRTVKIGTPDFAAAGSETLFAGAVTLNNRPATFQGGNDFRTRFTGPITGSGAVTVTGTGAGRVVVFDGGTGNDFTYTGGTTVASGTLLAVGQGPTMSATGTGLVTVTGGALGGTGRVAGGISATGGRVVPGTASAPGILTVGAGATFNNVATFAARLNGTTAGTGYDQLRVESGTVSLGNAGLSLIVGYTPSPTDVLVIVRNDGTGTTTGQFAGFAPGAPVQVGSSTAYVYYNYDTATGLFGPGNDVAVTFSPVPEPAAAMGLAAGVFGLGRLASRRRG